MHAAIASPATPWSCTIPISVGGAARAGANVVREAGADRPRYRGKALGEVTRDHAEIAGAEKSHQQRAAEQHRGVLREDKQRDHQIPTCVAIVAEPGAQRPLRHRPHVISPVMPPKFSAAR